MADNAFPYDAAENRPDTIRVGWVTTYSYDKNRRLIGHTSAPVTPRADTPEDAALERLPGNVTTCIYDAQRCLTGMIFPDGMRVSYPLTVDEKAEEDKTA